MDEKHGLKAKTIKSIIRRKIDSWLATIEDTQLKAKLGKNIIVTGGAIASMLLGEPVSDFDIYFRDFATTKWVAEYYLARFKAQKRTGIDIPISLLIEGERIKIVAKSAGIASENGTDRPYEYFESAPPQHAEDYVQEVINDPERIEDTYQETESAVLKTKSDDKKPKYRPIFLTTNAITLSDKIQLVIRFHGEPDSIHENYDFAHCTNYWTSWDSDLVLRPKALEALLSRTLHYVGSKYPICSLVRVRKFIERGWRINAGQLVKMAFQISELNLKDLKVLEDQLTGVDTAYFIQLINVLKEKDRQQVDSAYLIEIIDRIF